MEIMDRGIKITRSNMETYLSMLWDRVEELEEQNENLTELVESKEETISELTKELDLANDEVLRLENKISDMQC